MMETCKIQWIDDHGKPTPDDNPAVGTAVHWSEEELGATRGRTEKRFPICAKHLEAMRLFEDSEAWYPGTGTYKSGWTFEALSVDSTFTDNGTFNGNLPAD